jgi:lipoprotein-anchoring transpeptidase ErfK/SrfK
MYQSCVSVMRSLHLNALVVGLVVFGASEANADPALRPPGSIPQASLPSRSYQAPPAYRSSHAYARDNDVTGSIPQAAPPQAEFSEGSTDLPPELRRQLVNYTGHEVAGTIVIDTDHTRLYLVLGGGQAIRYGVGVGRDGFRWSGRETITRGRQWPDWYPPSEMIERQPYLPRFMAGGPGNPLGARALYLGSSVYRIHGTNDPKTIGQFISSGCIRLLNEDISDLYARVGVGTPVVVLPSSRGAVS